MPTAAGAMPDEAGDLGLMHREDHAGRGAGTAECVAHVGDVGDRGFVAAVGGGDLDPEELFTARGINGLPGKTRLAIDYIGCSGRDLCYGVGPLLERNFGRSRHQAAGRRESVAMTLLHVNDGPPTGNERRRSEPNTIGACRPRLQLRRCGSSALASSGLPPECSYLAVPRSVIVAVCVL